MLKVFMVCVYLFNSSGNFSTFQSNKMRTEEINIYQFSELSEKAKQKAIENRRYWNVEHNWWSFIYDQFKEEHPQYEDCEISFSGFSSQGDGASFTFRLDSAYFEKWVEGLDIPEWKKAILTHYTPEFTGERNTHHYSHKYTVSICLSSEDHNRENIDALKFKYYHEFLELLRVEFYSHCDELYRTLESEYDHLTSDECMKE